MSREIIRLTDSNYRFIDRLVAIEERAFGAGGLNQWGLVPMIKHGAVYVIEIDARPVGLAEYMRDFEELDTAYLYGLAVAKKYRNQGLGRQLLAYSLEQIEARGISRVELTVAPDNSSALNLYRKFGFKKKNYHEDMYGTGEDRLVMVKKI